MQSHARIVIIGGGVVGTSALYHLVERGVTDCLLVERNELTSGSTWHAAGNCPNFSTSWNTIKFQRHSTRLYARLGDAVGYPINYHITGSIRLAHGRDRMDEYRHVVSMARAQGIDFDLLSPSEIRAKYPHITLDDIVGGLWDPFDGDIDPSQLTQAFAKGARDLGAQISRFTEVKAIERTSTGEWLVKTDKGDVTCETIVNAAGYRAGEIMAMVGHTMPIVSMSHQYLVTEAIAELAEAGKKLPLLRDPDDSYYLRQERDGLLLGPYEWQATPHWLDGLPADFSHQLFPDDLDRLERYIERAVGRVPILGTVGVQRVINGPIPYSPDGNPYIGPAHGLPNFYQCCCFSFGIAQAGGAGKTIAEWIIDGDPEWDFWGFDPRRYTDYATKSYVVARAIELYQNEYAIGFPVEERPAGRPAKTTPVYEKLKAKGAFFCARGGWERAGYFPSAGQETLQRPSFRRQEMASFDAVAEECRAVREAVGLLDLGGFSKFMVEGPGAARWLDRIICGRLPAVGRISLTWILNTRGGIVSEFTISRLAADRFYLVSAAAAEWHDLDVLNGHLPADGSVRIDNLTTRLGALVLAGPNSREVLARISEDDVSCKALPWLSHREIEIGFARLRVLRVGYVGELGYELHAPIEHLGALYDRLWTAGADLGLRDFGMYAMDSLRLEKCYRGWKGDITHEYSPLKANFDRFVAFDKPDFIGKEALLAERAAGPVERLVPLVLEEAGEADAPYCSSVWHGNERVGLTVSSGYGHAIGKSIALAYVRGDLIALGTELDVEILGERRKAWVSTDPIYDPTNARLKM
jgi:dimethylglycine dehydrogenase